MLYLVLLLFLFQLLASAVVAATAAAVPVVVVSYLWCSCCLYYCWWWWWCWCHFIVAVVAAVALVVETSVAVVKRFEEIWRNLKWSMGWLVENDDWSSKRIDWLLSCTILRSNIKIPRSIVKIARSIMKIPGRRIFRVIEVPNMIGDRRWSTGDQGDRRIIKVIIDQGDQRSIRVIDDQGDWRLIKGIDEYTCRLLFQAGILAFVCQKVAHTEIKWYPQIIGWDHEFFTSPNWYRTQQERKG